MQPYFGKLQHLTTKLGLKFILHEKFGSEPAKSPRNQKNAFYWQNFSVSGRKKSKTYSRISSNVYEPLITEKSVSWAFKFVEHLTKRMLFMADSYVYENVFDEKCQKVIRYLRQAGGALQHSKLLNKTHESADVLKKVIETLVEKQNVEVLIDSSGRVAKRSYKLLE